MGVINIEDIVGYLVGQECVCYKCVNDQEEMEASENEIITIDAVESCDAVYCCNRCRKQLAMC